MSRRRAPMRRCVHCGASRPKGELIRIVRTPGGEVVLDETQRQAGRGAYVCPQATCADGFLQSHRGAGPLGAGLPHDLAERLREVCRRSAC